MLCLPWAVSNYWRLMMGKNDGFCPYLLSVCRSVLFRVVMALRAPDVAYYSGQSLLSTFQARLPLKCTAIKAPPRAPNRWLRVSDRHGWWCLCQTRCCNIRRGPYWQKQAHTTAMLLSLYFLIYSCHPSQVQWDKTGLILVSHLCCLVIDLMNIYLHQMWWMPACFLSLFLYLL